MALCKLCGTENDDRQAICIACGSPLVNDGSRTGQNNYENSSSPNKNDFNNSTPEAFVFENAAADSESSTKLKPAKNNPMKTGVGKMLIGLFGSAVVVCAILIAIVVIQEKANSYKKVLNKYVDAVYTNFSTDEAIALLEDPWREIVIDEAYWDYDDLYYDIDDDIEYAYDSIWDEYYEYSELKAEYEIIDSQMYDYTLDTDEIRYSLYDMGWYVDELEVVYFDINYGSSTVYSDWAIFAKDDGKWYFVDSDLFSLA